MRILFLLFIAALFILSCQNKPVSKWKTLKFIQEKAVLTHINLGDTAHGHGDAMAFEAALKDTSGNVVGEILGWIITTDIMEGDSAAPIYVMERIGSVVLNFGNEDEIVSQGIVSYTKGEKLIKLGAAQTSAITGGTGKFKGISGQLTTTRNEDGSYLHVLEVKQD
jgi:hypothetical protein